MRWGAVWAAVAVLLTACGAPAATGAQAPSPSRGLLAVVASSDLAVGPNHFALGLLDEHNQPLAALPVYLSFYELSGGEPALVAQVEAVWRQPLSAWDRGVYKADVTFASPGAYGVEATVVRAPGDRQTARARFEVRPQPAAPGIGAPAPRSRNLTNRDAVDPIELCTGSAELCAATRELRELTIAEALEQRKPLVVVFATPGFCTSQTCGPQLEVVRDLVPRYRGRANFIHVEIFKDPASRTPNATVQEWGLPSEPWVFVLDRDGRIADRFDGITTAEEIEGALQRLLASDDGSR
jgi:peroxiredoxin